MGIKAVSAPVLASETAVRFWRGSIVLAWQLWYVMPIFYLLLLIDPRVACGILVGSIINIAIANATGYLHEGEDRSRLALRLILGAPAVPALFLIFAVAMCYESPRYYMRSDTPGYNIDRAFSILLKIRSHRVGPLSFYIFSNANIARLALGLTRPHPHLVAKPTREDRT
jgi:hypothetical protein